MCVSSAWSRRLTLMSQLTDAGFSETETITRPYLSVALHEMLHDFTFPMLQYCFFQVLFRCLHRDTPTGQIYILYKALNTTKKENWGLSVEQSI